MRARLGGVLWLGAVSSLAVWLGCNAIIGLELPEHERGGTTSSGGGLGGTGGIAGATGGFGGYRGDGGFGGFGGGGGFCEPGEVKPCYSGAFGALGVGMCHAGDQACNADGTGYGPCEGEVVPTTEDVGTPFADESCDGLACDRGNPSGASCGDYTSGCIGCALDGNCADEYSICNNDQDCVDYESCVNPCADQACADQCAAQHPNGEALFHDIVVCVICEECPIDCDAAGSSDCP